jgi:dUTP pyrophosphatase
MTKLKFWRTHSNNVLPKKQTKGSACFDLMFQGHGKGEYKGYTRMNKPFTRPMHNQIVIQPGDRIIVPTGLIIDIPEGHSVRVHARSGMSLKQGLVLANAEGVIDSDYVEELMVLVYNLSDNSITIQSGDRIAQAELIKDEDYEIEETAVRPGVKTSRIGGMGSTGVSSQADIIKITVAEPPPSALSDVKKGRGRPKKNA